MKDFILLAAALVGAEPAFAADVPACGPSPQVIAAPPAAEAIAIPTPVWTSEFLPPSWVWSPDPFNYFGYSYHPTRVILEGPDPCGCSPSGFAGAGSAAPTVCSRPYRR